MTRRKFREVTRGGYHVRNIEQIQTNSPFVLRAEISNHTGQPPSDDPVDWHVETFTKNGKYQFYSTQSPFDLIEDTQ